MTQQEYKNKKRECWEEFKRENLDGEVQWQPVSRYDVFCAVFDRAYALGKQFGNPEQVYIEKAAEKFADKIKIPASIPGVMIPLLHDIAKSSYQQGAQDCLGKQESKQDTVISGWVARASDGHLALFKRKPDREIYMGSSAGLWFGGSMTELDANSFPDLTWDSEPEEVEIILKRKKKNIKM